MGTTPYPELADHHDKNWLAVGKAAAAKPQVCYNFGRPKQVWMVNRQGTLKRKALREASVNGHEA